MIKRVGLLNHRFVDGYMAAHETMLAPLYGNIAAHGWMYNSGALRSGRIMAQTQGDQVTGMLARFNDGNCMVHVSDPDEMEGFLDELDQLQFHTLWMLGLPRSSAAAVNQYLGLRAQVVEHWMMEQRHPVTVPSQELAIFEISGNPFSDEILNACCDLLEACFDYRPSRKVFTQRMLERDPAEPYYLGMYQGVWVGQAHVQAWTPHFGHIGGVATLPAYRGRGFAKMMTSHICQYIISQGRVPSLTVRKDNTTAMALYQGMGFVPVGEVSVLDAYTTIRGR